MTEQTETRPVEFGGRTIQTVKPNEGQLAVLVRMGFWRRNYGEEADPANAAQFARQLSALNRLFTLIAALIHDQADWDWIEDRMADSTFTGEEVMGLLITILRLWSDGADDNRAARRAKKTSARRITTLPPVDGRAS